MLLIPFLSLRSIPAQKALSPAPVIIIARISSSFSISSIIFFKLEKTALFKLFIASGRFNVTTAKCSRFERSTTSSFIADLSVILSLFSLPDRFSFFSKSRHTLLAVFSAYDYCQNFQKIANCLVIFHIKHCIV